MRHIGTALVGFGVLAVALGGAFSAAGVPPPPVLGASEPVRRDRGEGGVQIEVLYVTAAYAQRSNEARFRQWQPEKFAVFRVAMDTHSVDLSGYDMVKISELVAGGKRYAPLRWERISDSSHHRSGALIFPKVDRPLPVELLIKSVAGVPVRSFRWEP